jgi:hypothetical protein
VTSQHPRHRVESEPDMDNHLGFAGFHNHVTGAGSDHLADALVFQILTFRQPLYPAPGGLGAHPHNHK